MKKLYYTVCVNHLSSNWKLITVYTIEDNQPKIFCEIESSKESSDEVEIQTYLDNNGYEDEEFEFEKL